MISYFKVVAFRKIGGAARLTAYRGSETHPTFANFHSCLIQTGGKIII